MCLIQCVNVIDLVKYFGEAVEILTSANILRLLFAWESLNDEHWSNNLQMTKTELSLFAVNELVDWLHRETDEKTAKKGNNDNNAKKNEPTKQKPQPKNVGHQNVCQLHSWTHQLSPSLEERIRGRKKTQSEHDATARKSPKNSFGLDTPNQITSHPVFESLAYFNEWASERTTECDGTETWPTIW